MNKTQLIDAIASDSNTTKVEAKKIIDAFINVTNSTLSAGDKVSIVGFGTFNVITKPERNGRNPKTGAAIKISEKKVIKFKPGTELSDLIKN